MFTEESILERSYWNWNYQRNLRLAVPLIREALLQLEKKGYIVHKPNIGAIVEKINLKKAEEIYKIIALLEGYAVEIVADGNIDKEDISYLKTLQKEMEIFSKTKNYFRYTDKNQEFHAFFVKKCGNEILYNIVSDLRNRVFIIFAPGFTLPIHIDNYLESHKKIINAISNKEPLKAGEIMRNHDLDAIKFMIIEQIK